jgi:hypothetical protein
MGDLKSELDKWCRENNIKLREEVRKDERVYDNERSGGTAPGTSSNDK